MNRLISYANLQAFVQSACESAGVPAEEAAVMANLLIRADLRGVESHGATRLPIYILRGLRPGPAHEMLTAVLTGGKWTADIKSLYEEDPGGIQGTCHSFMAIDPDCFIGRQAFKEAMDRYIRAIKNSPTARDVAEILLPGESSHRIELERRKSGIPVAPNTAQDLTKLADSLGLTIRWEA